MRIDEFEQGFKGQGAGMQHDLPEISGQALMGLRKLMGDDKNKTMQAKRGIEFIMAGKALPANLSSSVSPLLQIVVRFLEGGMGDVNQLAQLDQRRHGDEIKAQQMQAQEESIEEDSEKKKDPSALNKAIQDQLRKGKVIGLTNKVKSEFPGRAKIIYNQGDIGAVDAVQQAISAVRDEEKALNQKKDEQEKKAEERKKDKEEAEKKRREKSADKQKPAPATVSIQDDIEILKKLSGI